MVLTQDGIHILKERVKNLPNTPGVYRMLNAAGDVLYVGKAKALKKRVTNYTQAERLSTRIRKMVFETHELVVVETATEVEALLLEANLIKSLKPKYNVLLRDDKSFVSILITHDDSPLIQYHRGAKKKKGDYFGPYPSSDAVYRTLDMLERTFQLRTCKDTIFKHRTRPCLKYDIKRCTAPCVGKVSKEAYAEQVAEAKMFLKGQGKAVKKRIQNRMLAAAEKEDYERAALERDKLQALTYITNNRSALTNALTDADVFGLVQQGGKVAVQMFSYRGGQHVGNIIYYPRATEELTDAEIMRVFLALHYAQHYPPRHIITSHTPAEADVLQAAFSQNTSYKVTIATPKQGERLKIVQEAQRNAAQNLSRKMAEAASWQAQMQAFGELLNLTHTPKRIEAFDISNISGTQAVASMVVAGTEDMLKSAYRKFTIKTKDTPDDYAMMHEALSRRYAKLMHALKQDTSPPTWPDIILVDGGIGHLNTLLKVAEELNITTLDNPPALCAIAKGEERDKGLEKIYHWRNGAIEQLPIPFNTPLIFMLQRVRDEAHRFAIGFHRQRRSKALTKSVLDTIPRIGPKRKKALLLHFGAADAIKNASVEELCRVEGISTQLAEEIYNWLHA